MNPPPSQKPDTASETTPPGTTPAQFKLFMMRHVEVTYRSALLVSMDTTDDEHFPHVFVGVLTVPNEVFARGIQHDIDEQGKYLLHPDFPV